MTTTEMRIPLRVLIDKERNKVVFAEAENDFVDILFSFLTMPMGTIVRLLSKQSDPQPKALGSLNSLFEGISNLETKYFSNDNCKDMLLNPRNSSEFHCLKLKVNIDDAQPTKFFICETTDCKGSRNSYYNTAKCSCGKLMTKEITLKDPKGDDGDGIFTMKTATFVISDDLHVMPNEPGSIMGLLTDLGIKDMTTLQEKTFNIGSQEILNLLKLALVSITPLTDLFVCKKSISSKIFKKENGISADIQNVNAQCNTTTKMTLKVMVRKTNNKLLFAQAQEDFVDFIFNILTIPLGEVVSLLDCKSLFGSINNLYKGMSSLNVGRYVKSWLLNPKQAPLYICLKQFFPPNIASNQLFCISCSSSGHLRQYLTPCFDQLLYHMNVCVSSNLVDPKCGEGFIKRPAMFMVTDDLIVSPLSTISSMSYLSKLKIPYSDVQELVVDIGIKEALSILKASLCSTSVLTDGLDFILKKPKSEN